MLIVELGEREEKRKGDGGRMVKGAWVAVQASGNKGRAGSDVRRGKIRALKGGVALSWTFLDIIGLWLRSKKLSEL